MSKNVEEYGEEDQPLRWARYCKILEKREKISSVWRRGEITQWQQVGVPLPVVC
jgi:hypothetical protein